jgi:hypothetical protein
MLMRMPGSEAEYAPGKETVSVGEQVPEPVTRMATQDM